MARKILIGIFTLLIILAIGYAIARPRIPEWTVQVIMNQLEEDNYAAVLESEDLNLTEEQEFLLQKALETFSYEITGSRIERKMAYVYADITFVDMAQLINDNRQQLLRNVLGNLGNILSGGMEQLIMEELIELLDDETLQIPLLTQSVEIPLEKSGLLWSPLITEEWLKSELGLDELELNQLESSLW